MSSSLRPPANADEAPREAERSRRFRWYHLYFLLALFDVAVIMFSLHLHGRTIDDANALIESASRMDAQLRWFQTAQQRVIELNAPGNDLFRANQPADYELLERRMRSAQANIETLFSVAGSQGVDLTELNNEIQALIAAADELFAEFKPLAAPGGAQEEKQAILVEAGPKMAEMDEQQHKALWILGGLVAQHSEKKNLLMQEHEARLHLTSIYQRSFVAIVILILVGALHFGRRLHASDRALAEQRRLLADERRERLAAIGELCSSVAHGIRNPLAAICSSVELTLDVPDLDPKTSQRLHETLREGERLGARVN